MNLKIRKKTSLFIALCVLAPLAGAQESDKSKGDHVLFQAVKEGQQAVQDQKGKAETLTSEEKEKYLTFLNNQIEQGALRHLELILSNLADRTPRIGITFDQDIERRVADIRLGSPADLAGVRVGHIIIEVNDEDVSKLNSEATAALIAQSPNPVKLTFAGNSEFYLEKRNIALDAELLQDFQKRLDVEKSESRRIKSQLQDGTLSDSKFQAYVSLFITHYRQLSQDILRAALKPMENKSDNVDVPAKN